MNVLIIDDHPITVAGYVESMAHKNFFAATYSFFKAYSGEEAYVKLNTIPSVDLAIIDYGLPPYPEKNIFSGSDLALMIKAKHPACKLIMITAHTEVLLVFDIFKTTNPDGFIIKNDLTPENLPDLVQEVLKGNILQSPTVKKVIQEIWKKELMIDDLNRQIIMYLSKGYKIREIESISTLSMSAIQRRIALMKDVFGVSEDSSLVKEANRQGFL